MTRPTRFLSSSNSSTSSAAAQPPEPVSVESDFVVILAALLCALICMVGLIAVARCAWLRGSAASDRRRTGQPSGNRGLKKKILRTLPKFTYESSSSVAAAGVCNLTFLVDCAICLAEYAEGDEIRVLPQCGHGFHANCIDTWLGSHSSCPSCRQILAVTRCRKCGELPAVSGVTLSETEIKSRQDLG